MNTRNTKTKLLIGASVLTAVLAGCEMPPAEPSNPAVVSQASVFVWVDTETGCQYLHRNDIRAGITPRLGGDGKPMCGGVAR